jgi:hypothetical protein
MEEWCRLCPGDVEYEHTFYALKTTEERARWAARAEKRRKKAFIEAQLNGPSMVPGDDRWDGLWLTTVENTDNGKEFSDNLSDE